jgi:polyhydroxyalkanoate synthesis regulator phasin
LLNYFQNLAGQRVASWDDLDSHIGDLSKQIVDAQAQGKLTTTQAADFKTQLSQVQAQEAQAKQDGKRLGFAQSIQFGQQLSSISGSLDQAMSQTVSSLPDVDALRAQMQASVDKAVTDGRINKQAAATLQAEIQSEVDVETAYKTETGGNLTPRQIEILSDRLNKVKAEIDQQTKISQSGSPALRDRQKAIADRIQADQAAGRLTAQSAGSLNADLAKIAAEQQGCETAGGGMLNGTQVFRLAQELDTIEEREKQGVAAATSQAPPAPPVVSTADLDAMLASLTTRVNQLTTSGAISPTASAQDVRELDHISWDESTMKAGSGITSGQVQDLLSRAVKLGTAIDTQTQAPATASGPMGGEPGGHGFGPGWGRGFSQGSGRPGSDQGGTGFAQGPGGPGFGQGTGGPGSDPGQRDYWQRRHPEGGSQYAGEMTGAGFPPPAGSGQDFRHPHGGTEYGGNRDRQRMQTEELANATPPAAAPAARFGGNPIGSLPIIAQKSFSDAQGYWAQPYIEQLASRGVIGGFPNGTFGPDQPITRAQFAAIVAHALHLDTSASGSNFRDVPDNYWAAGAIAAASKGGLITGFPDGSFHPEDKITRAQALVILSKALQGAPLDDAALNKYSDAGSVPSWARNSITQAANANIIVSFPDAQKIRANDTATRGDVAALMYQTLVALGAELPPVSIGLPQ